MTEDLIQGSDEWLKARVGSLGASRLADALAKTKSGWGASRANLMAELIAERLTGEPTKTFISTAMQWGTDTEPQAKDAYAFYRDTEVIPVGLVRHPTIANTHASPDGYIGDAGLIEVKCPSSGTHLETLLGASIDRRYHLQMMWQMACTGRAWCDFVSFDPRLPENMQLHVARVSRDDAVIAELESEVRMFLDAVDMKLSMLRNRKAAA